MSSPLQPPAPNMRSPSIASQQSASQPNNTSALPSPYAHHLTTPNLPSSAAQPPASQQSSTANNNVSLPPPPRVTELPSILSSTSPRSSSPSYPPQQQAHHHHPSLPPASSFATESQQHPGSNGPNPTNNNNNPILPPISPRTSSTSPYTERRPSMARPPAPSSSIQPPAPHSQVQQQQQRSSPAPASAGPAPLPSTQAVMPATNANSASPAPAAADGNYRPLNVRDALTYLDQVKVRFSDQPDVYNRFLDIMKDFKSQAIDTPGVIERVSTLFQGHPTLISGFNTFLPPGYRIECSTDPREPDLITVTTPNGVTTTTNNRLRIEAMENSAMHGHPSMPPTTSSVAPPPPIPQSHHTGLPPPHHQHHHHHGPPPPPHHQQQHQGHPQPPPQPYYPYSHHMHQPAPPQHMQQQQQHSHPSPMPPPPHPSMMSQPLYHQQQHPPPPPRAQHQQQQPLPSMTHPPPPPAPSSHHAGMVSSPTQSTISEKRSPIEFNQAINYVNKIKNRFSNEPEVYKQFLEILQTYQKDGKPIQEVYAHVQYLFNGAPDLLDEFKQFLPDITGQSPSVLFDTMSSANYYNEAAPMAGGGTKRGGEMPPSNSMLPPGKKKRTTQGNAKKSKYQKEAQGGAAGMNGNGDVSMRDPYSYPSSPFDPIRPSVSSEEIELFDRIKKHIGNKPSYEEFLKTLNLYTEQILDLNTLVEQVGVFIGNNKELYDWFKSSVGYEPKEHPIEKPANPVPKPDLAHCKATVESPSYRIVPKEWQTQPCSGRDQIAWEVLNDEYVSHPIWASEDDGFVASKKSQFEEAMHRCEEERYDYNMHIDANSNVIALLEPINQRIEMMSAEERANFTLEPGLGGQTVTIYERIIKKIYNKDRGTEIIKMLYTNPAQVIPILLRRLKMKNEEWKQAQREWNKIWREMDAKNYYRALDYQGITFKSTDRKAMAPKALVSEIESLQQEKKMKDSSFISCKAVPTTENYQLKFPFGNTETFKDVTRVIYSYIDGQSGYSGQDREKIRTFIKSFIPLCFQVDDVVPEGLPVYDDMDEEELAEDEDDNNSTDTNDSESEIGRSPSKRSQSPSRRRSGRTSRSQADEEHTMDLLRDVLTKNQNAIDERTTSSSIRSLSPTPDGSQQVKTEDEAHTTNGLSSPSIKDEQDVDMTEAASSNNSASNSTANTEATGEKILAAAAAATAPEVKKRTFYSFFCNTTFYCFFRQYEMLYSRLATLSSLDEKMKRDPNMGKRVNKVARDLGLYSSRFDDVDVSKGYYNFILDLIDRFFDNDVDQQVFEEHSRYIFTTDAYLIFTIDKLVHSMIKQIQAITVDPKSVELIRLFRSDKALDSMSPRLLSVYRFKAEDIVGSEENLYRINFDNQANVMTIQLIGSDDYMMEPTAEDKYEDYVASYMDWGNTTDGIDTSKMTPTFLTRNLRPQNEHLDKIFVRSKLQYKIDQSTYHMYYIEGSEDVFVRSRLHQSKEKE